MDDEEIGIATLAALTENGGQGKEEPIDIDWRNGHGRRQASDDPEGRLWAIGSERCHPRSKLSPARLILALMVLGVLAFPAGADAFVYWANSAFDDDGLEAIGRANNDGSFPDQSFITGTVGPCGVAVDANHIYWGNSSTGTIGRADLDGANVNQSFIDPPGGVCGIAVDAGHIYWASAATGTTVGRANLDGTSPDPAFIGGLPTDVCGVAVDSTYVYWAGGGAGAGRVGRAPLATQVAEPNFMLVSDFPCGVAVNSTSIFWGHANGTVGRADISGGSQDNAFISGTGANVCGVAVDASHLYWSNSTALGPPPKTIGRSSLDGSSPNNAFIGGTSGSCGVAVDSLADASPPKAKLSSPGGKKGQKAKKRVGLVVSCGIDACLATVNGLLDVVPAGGPKSSASAGTSKKRQSKKRRYKLKSVSLQIPAGGSATATLKIPKKALKQVRKALKHKGKARVKFTAHVTDSAGNSSTAKKTVKLRR